MIKKHLISLLALLAAAALLAGCVKTPGVTPAEPTGPQAHVPGPEAGVETAIDAIGAVSLDSLEAIARAEALYEALSPEDQGKVANAAVLAAARERYDQLVLLDAAAQALEAIPPLIQTIPGYTVQEPRSDWDCPDEELPELIAILEEEGCTVELSADGQTLTVTYPEYPYISLKDFPTVRSLVTALQAVEEAGLHGELTEAQILQISAIAAPVITACNQKSEELTDLQERADLGAALVAAFPDLERKDREQVQYLCYSAHKALAEAALEKGNYEAAWELCNQCFDYTYDSFSRENLMYAYADALEGMLPQTEDKRERISGYNEVYQKILELEPHYSGDWKYQSLREDVEEELEYLLSDIRPEDGAILDSTLRDTYAEFKLTAGDTDVCFKVYNADDPEIYTLVYVYSGSSRTILLPYGRFQVSCAAGEGLYWEDETSFFGAHTTFYHFEGLETDFSYPLDDGVLITYRHNGTVAASILVEGQLNPALVPISAGDF